MTIATTEQLAAAKASIVARRASAPASRVYTPKQRGPAPETFVTRNSPQSSYLTCPHRGDVVATTTGNMVGCGCGGTRVEFYECQHFGETVLKDCKEWAKRSNQEKIQAVCPTYKGRTCRECELWADPKSLAAILHVTQREGWQAIIQRATFALRGTGLICREIPKPTPSRLTAQIRSSGARLVFVHAFAVSAKQLIPIVEQHPAVKFVAVVHSQENHVLTWPQIFADMQDLLAATKHLPNLYFAGSDQSTHWQTLGYSNVLRWHWPCILPPAAGQLPAVDPPLVLITSRADLVKALPSQILAAAILQRQRGVRVALSLRNEADKAKAGIDNLVQASGLVCDRWPWASPSGFLARLRQEVSIVLQPSMSETFNYVTYEAGSVGRPWVGSNAIQHTPAAWRADPNSPADIARVAGEILDDYQHASRQARQIAEQVASMNNTDYAAFVGGLKG